MKIVASIYFCILRKEFKTTKIDNWKFLNFFFLFLKSIKYKVTDFLVTWLSTYKLRNK